MALAIDPQVLAELAPLLAAVGEIENPPIGDVQARRINGHRMFDHVAAQRTPAPGVLVERHTVPAADGTLLDASWYHLPATPGSAVLYLHGGGMIFGLDHIGAMYDVAVRDYVAHSGVPMLVVDYRVAPEHPHPTPVEDCYAALRWLAENAPALGADPARIAVMGDSAGTDRVSQYAAPARADDLTLLPPTYLDTGDLDIFRDEDIAYARRLADAGVPTELHLHPGCPHAFEGLASGADVSHRAINDRIRRLRSL